MKAQLNTALFTLRHSPKPNPTNINRDSSTPSLRTCNIILLSRHRTPSTSYQIGHVIGFLSVSMFHLSHAPTQHLLLSSGRTYRVYLNLCCSERTHYQAHRTRTVKTRRVETISQRCPRPKSNPNCAIGIGVIASLRWSYDDDEYTQENTSQRERIKAEAA